MHWRFPLHYAITVYHAGRHVATEIAKASSFNHACWLAQYGARTLALQVMPPAEFDADKVTWAVED
jgi:hypothetical protein